MALRSRTELTGWGWIDCDENDLALVGGVGPVRVGDRLLPREADVTFPSDERGPALRLKLSVVSGIPLCSEVHIEAKAGGREVRTSDLRAIALEDWIEMLYAHVAKRVTEIQEDGSIVAVDEPNNDSRVREAVKVVQRARALNRRTITGAFLHEVAQVYREHVEGRPTEQVARAFGVEHTTAAKYVQRARKAGALPPTTRGRKKG